MGKVIMSGIVPQLEEPVTIDPVFENNEWKTIIKACQKNKVPDTWVVGSQKTMTINGTDYPVDIIGKNHDVYSDGSGTAPLTFQMHNSYGTKYGMNSGNDNGTGWTSSAMRTTHLPSILALMPSEVQVGVKEVGKKTSSGAQSSTIKTTADTLFLLSEIEVSGKTNITYAGEGSQYDYYKAGNSKKKTGGHTWWWLRSPSKTNTTYFAVIDANGDTTAESSFYCI